jgi:hypothetical protein
MKVHLFHRQESPEGMQLAILTHVKCVDCDGRYVAFMKIAPPLIEIFRKMDFDITEHLLKQRGIICLNIQTPNI